MLIWLHTIELKSKLALIVHLNIAVLDCVNYCHSIIKLSNITVCLLSRYKLGQWQIGCGSKLWVSLTANGYKLYIPVLLSKGFSVSISDQAVGSDGRGIWFWHIMGVRFLHLFLLGENEDLFFFFFFPFFAYRNIFRKVWDEMNSEIVLILQCQIKAKLWHQSEKI